MSADLERALSALPLAWPETPDLAAAVDGRLAAPERPARRARRPRRRFVAVALAGALLGLGTAGAAFPEERDDVLRWLGLRSVEVERVPALPADARRAPLADLGASVDLDEARRRAGFAALLPRVLGGPEAVRVREGRVSLIYEEGRLLVTEVRGALDRGLLRKLVGPGTAVRDTPDGVFFGGRDHVVLFKDASGAVVQDRPRLAGPTLLTERGDVLVRIEGRGLTEARAREIARSLRP